VRVGTMRSAGQMSVHLALPGGGFRLDDGTGHHLILFAQQERQGAIEGAGTAPL
jgi:hypothetical protein